MWQRHTQRGRVVCNSGLIATGCGSWTTIMSHSSASVSASAFSRLYSMNVSRCSAVEPLGIALKRVVDGLGDVEELVAAVDHPPLGLDADVVQQRDQRVLDLGHAAAERGCREVQHAPPLQRLGQLADLVGERAADDRRVIGKILVANVDALHLH